jgi:hypothetical protein
VCARVEGLVRDRERHEDVGYLGRFFISRYSVSGEGNLRKGKEAYGFQESLRVR